jgi:hypothetical protein
MPRRPSVLRYRFFLKSIGLIYLLNDSLKHISISDRVVAVKTDLEDS